MVRLIRTDRDDVYTKKGIDCGNIFLKLDYRLRSDPFSLKLKNLQPFSPDRWNDTELQATELERAKEWWLAWHLSINCNQSVLGLQAQYSASTV